MPTAISARPMRISTTPTQVSSRRGRVWGADWARRVARVRTVVAPITHPARNGIAASSRWSESRIRIVAMIGTVLTAAAIASGSS